MRLFIGIKTGCETHLVSLQEELKKGGRGRYADTRNLHLTLKFLGEVPPAEIRGICAAMDEAKMPGFSLECRGVHMFNQSGIVSAEIGGELGKLFELQGLLENALEKRGFPKETRRFRPHITLARDYKPGDYFDFGAIIVKPCGFTVKETILFQSTRKDGRLVYLPLYTCKLN